MWVVSPIFPPVLLTSPYHFPLLPPLHSNNATIFSSSLIVQKLIHAGHAILLKLKPTIETKEKLCGRWDLHILKAKRAYQELSEVSTLSKSDFSIDIITFDLQQSLPTPVLSNNVVFYKYQLWTYTLGIHKFRYCTLHPFVFLVLTPFFSPHSLSKLQLFVPPLSPPSLSFSLSPPRSESGHMMMWHEGIASRVSNEVAKVGDLGPYVLQNRL